MLKLNNNLLKIGFGCISSILLITTFSMAQGNTNRNTNPDPWGDIDSGFGTHSDSVSQIKGVVGTANVSGKTGSADLLNTAKNTVNWALGMLSLIALVVLLWGGFQMITAAGDESKHKKGFTILKQAAIGLIFVGLSWLIVSLIFWLISTMTSSTP